MFFRIVESQVSIAAYWVLVTCIFSSSNKAFYNKHFNKRAKMALDHSPEYFRGLLPAFFLGNEALKTKSLFCQPILKKSPVNVISKSVTTPAIIITAMNLMNQNFANRLWDRSPKDNFLKKNTHLIEAKNIIRTRVPHADANDSLLFFGE